MQMQYFDIKEFDCQETGTNEMNPFFLEKLDQLRHQCGFPFKITSGYRDPTHSIEARKTRPGTHARGIAADIQINSGSEGYVIVKGGYEDGVWWHRYCQELYPCRCTRDCTGYLDLLVYIWPDIRRCITLEFLSSHCLLAQDFQLIFSFSSLALAYQQSQSHQRLTTNFYPEQEP